MARMNASVWIETESWAQAEKLARALEGGQAWGLCRACADRSEKWDFSSEGAGLVRLDGEVESWEGLSCRKGTLHDSLESWGYGRASELGMDIASTGHNSGDALPWALFKEMEALESAAAAGKAGKPRSI